MCSENDHSNSLAESPPSLYERLGGVYSIAPVVDDFIDRIMDDPRLNANPQVDEAHHRVSRSGFKYLVTEMVCWASGGPQTYTGRSMYDSHAHLEITESEWDFFMEDLATTFDQFKLPSSERAELVSIVESTKSEIVLAEHDGQEAVS
ncbi:MAG: group 1 truncated hemoglobin [Planctomycetota bacterium]|nr:group 1 truncated hemoglobin [Planctomycetota bacterium]